MTGQFLQFNKGESAYNTDWNNFAPSVGIAWTLTGRSGLLGGVFGDQEGDSVLGGYTLGYNRPGMSDFTGTIDDNPGIAQTANRNHTLGNLGTPGAILLRNPADLGPPAFSLTRQYPMTDVVTGGWSFDGIARVQSGRLLRLQGVRLIGMTESELQDMFKLRFDHTGRVVYMLPQDVIDNTVKAFSVSATSPDGFSDLGPPEGKYLAPENGPDCIAITEDFGECGPTQITLTGPTVFRFDLSAVKRVPVKGRLNLVIGRWPYWD